MVPWPKKEHGSAFEASAQSAEAIAENREEQEEVRQCLARLSSNHRQVLILRYYAELSVPDIARVMGWRQGTVKSRLHRALGQLRDILAAATADPREL